MTSYLHQRIATQRQADLIATAEAGRLSRLLTQARSQERREQRAARRSMRAMTRGTTRVRPANHALLSPNRIRVA
jgi:hypothetical protein